MSATLPYDAAVALVVEHYRPRRWAAKLLARAALASPRTAEDWLSGRHRMKAAAFWNAYQNDADLRAKLDAAVEESRRCRGA